MEALHDVVKAGKARYLGASSMWAWQFAKMQHAADLNGWTRFVSMQDQYSLMQREEEREMFGLLADQGVGQHPVEPPGQGPARPPVGRADEALGQRPVGQALTRRREPGRSPTPSSRSPKPAASRWRRSPSRGCCATRSSRAPIVGPTKPHHLADAVAALDVHLTDDEVAALEAPYTPREPTGF